MLSQYVWHGKKSRCSHSKLIKHRLYGGVGYIGFRDYFSASILTQTKEWFLPTPTTIWGSIESTYNIYGPTKLWLFAAQMGAKLPYYLPTTMKISIKTWLYLLSNHPTNVPQTTLEIPLQTLNIIINKIAFTSWIKRGITYLHNLYSDSTLKTFSDIQKEFHIPPTDFYQYAQIKHCLLKCPNFPQIIHTSAWSFLSSPAPIRKGITLFCNIFQQKQTFVKIPSRIQ